MLHVSRELDVSFGINLRCPHMASAYTSEKRNEKRVVPVRVRY